MKFIEESHSYFNDKGEQYTSVTTLLKKYQPAKDWKGIAEKYAKKHKKTVEEVEASWKEENKKAIDKGNAYHLKREKELVASGEMEINGKLYNVVETPLEDGVKLAIPLKLENAVYPELIIYSDKYKIAGQADRVEVVDDTIMIKDYKTNKEIKKESYKHWKNGHEKMLFPLNHLMNCNYWQYSMQLNLYMYMLKQHNVKLKVGTMELLHIKDDESVEVYDVPNLQEEAKKLLEHHYDTIKYSF